MSSYTAILTRPGAMRFSLAALVSRLPSSMAALGIVLLVQQQTGSYGRAGLVSAAYVLALAACAPLHGRLADHWGQGLVLWTTGTVFAVGVALLLLAVDVDASPPWTHLAAALAGLSTPQTGAMVRSRWTHVLRDDRDRLTTAYALEAVLDEVVFIVGPVLVTFLTLGVTPWSGLAVAGAAGTLGAWAFAAQRSTEPPPQPLTADRRAPMGWGVLGPVMLAAVGIGAMFGSMEVVVVAFTTEQGQRSWAGAVLAVWAAGSLAAGVLVGAFPPPKDTVARLRWTTVVLAGHGGTPAQGALRRGIRAAVPRAQHRVVRRRHVPGRLHDRADTHLGHEHHRDVRAPGSAHRGHGLDDHGTLRRGRPGRRAGRLGGGPCRSPCVVQRALGGCGDGRRRGMVLQARPTRRPRPRAGPDHALALGCHDRS